jgi:uncharacterized membrane protein YfcA
VSVLAAIVICLFGGLTGGLVGVGGGVLFVPALTIFIGLTQVEAESTSLLMIVLVAIGVLLGVAAANHISERALQLSFAALALFMAAQLVRRARAA